MISLVKGGGVWVSRDGPVLRCATTETFAEAAAHRGLLVAAVRHIPQRQQPLAVLLGRRTQLQEVAGTLQMPQGEVTRHLFDTAVLVLGYQLTSVPSIGRCALVQW